MQKVEIYLLFYDHFTARRWFQNVYILGLLEEMKNEDVRKVAIEQVKVLARLNKDA